MITVVETLIIFAIVLVIIELVITSNGILAFSGLASLFISLALIFTLKIPVPETFLQITIPSFGVLFNLSVVVLFLAYKAHKKRPLISDKPMLGKTGTCIKPIEKGKIGQVEIDGEIWEAESDQTIQIDEKIIVIDQNSLKLKVKKE